MARSAALSYAYGASSTPLIGLTIPDYLDLIVSRFPDNDAIVDVPTGRRWSYAQLQADCRRVAKSLMQLGIARGVGLAEGDGHPLKLLAEVGLDVDGVVDSINRWLAPSTEN